MIERICIIDDDKIYRFTTEKYIKMLKLAAHVTTFSDAEEALEYLKENIALAKNLPDIILLDVNMPMMDGWDFVNEFVELQPLAAKEIRLFMVTSSIDERDRHKAKEMHGIHDFIIKPISEEQLVQLVQKDLV